MFSVVLPNLFFAILFCDISTSSFYVHFQMEHDIIIKYNNVVIVLLVSLVIVWSKLVLQLLFYSKQELSILLSQQPGVNSSKQVRIQYLCKQVQLKYKAVVNTTCGM